MSGVELHIPKSCLTVELRHALNAQEYETAEAAALHLHLQDGDRYLELGAGAGYLCALAAMMFPGMPIKGVEAHPEMIATARGNVAQAGARDFNIVHAAVVPDEHTAAEVPFFAHNAFWRGSLRPQDVDATKVAVPSIPISDLLRDHAPTVVMMDIEGAETQFTDFKWPETVRLVIIETHLRLYPDVQALGRLIAGYVANGFVLSPLGTQADVLVFERMSGPYRDPRYPDD